MDLTLSPREQDLKARARAFAETWLFPQEERLEDEGRLPAETRDRLRRAVVEAGLNAVNHQPDVGGQGLTFLEQALVNEELGKATGGLWAVVWHPALPLKDGTPEQIERYLRPACLGQRRACFAITEKNAGSDPSLVETRADFRDGRYYLTGEKWFVTSGDVCDFILVHALVDGDPKKPTVFLVDKALPGVREGRHPKFMHTYVFGHPEFHFDRVELGPEQVLGEVGQGFELTKDWFVEARLQIAANCVGGAIRALETANTWAGERVQFGRPIRDFQAIEFMLADGAVEVMAAKSMLYRCAAEIDAGMDRKLVHARASALKLHCSEMAGRVVDRAVQILGGRGYMRENPVERLYRDLRVDRIWEGTSEIQRSIVGGQIRKRGLGVYTGWA